MQIQVSTEWAAENLRALSMGGEPRPRTAEDGTPKLAPNGKPTFSTGAVVARADGGHDRSITIAVTEPRALRLGALVKCDGEVWVTPYESNGRVALSIICDRLVPLAPAAKGAEA